MIGFPNNFPTYELHLFAGGQSGGKKHGDAECQFIRSLSKGTPCEHVTQCPPHALLHRVEICTAPDVLSINPVRIARHTSPSVEYCPAH